MTQEQTNLLTAYRGSGNEAIAAKKELDRVYTGIIGILTNVLQASLEMVEAIEAGKFPPAEKVPEMTKAAWSAAVTCQRLADSFAANTAVVELAKAMGESGSGPTVT